jgi:hypothetical protein
MHRAAPLRRAGAALLCLTAACGSGGTKSEAGYCKVINDHLTELATPLIANGADVTAAVALYQRVSDAAPLAVAPEWRTMLASIKAAAAVDPGKPETVQAATDAARESQVAANRIIAYTEERCGAALGLPGNTTTVPPESTPPATT